MKLHFTSTPGEWGNGFFDTDKFAYIEPNYAENSIDFYNPNDDGALQLSARVEIELEEDLISTWEKIYTNIKDVVEV